MMIRLDLSAGRLAGVTRPLMQSFGLGFKVSGSRVGFRGLALGFGVAGYIHRPHRQIATV